MKRSDVESLLTKLDIRDFPYVDQDEGRRDRAAIRRWPLVEEVARSLGPQPWLDASETRSTRNPRALSIAFVSPVGGAGQSTLVALLANTLWKAGDKVAALDLDPSNGLSFASGRGRSEVGIVHGSAALGPLLSRAVEEARSGPLLLPFGRVSGAELEVAADALRSGSESLSSWVELLEDDEEEERLLLFDLPKAPSPWGVEALRHVDRVVIVVPAQPAAFARLAALEQRLAEADERFAVSYLIGRYDPRSALERDLAASLRVLRGSAVLPFAFHEDPSIRDAEARKSSLGIEAPDSQVHDDISELAKWVVAQRVAQIGVGGTVETKKRAMP